MSEMRLMNVDSLEGNPIYSLVLNLLFTTQKWFVNLFLINVGLAGFRM